MNGVYWGYNPLILTFDPITSNGTFPAYILVQAEARQPLADAVNLELQLQLGQQRIGPGGVGTWRIIPFGRGTTPVRGLTNHIKPWTMVINHLITRIILQVAVK